MLRRRGKAPGPASWKWHQFGSKLIGKLANELLNHPMIDDLYTYYK
jgi:hypothetical protein